MRKWNSNTKKQQAIRFYDLYTSIDNLQYILSKNNTDAFDILKNIKRFREENNIHVLID